MKSMLPYFSLSVVAAVSMVEADTTGSLTFLDNWTDAAAQPFYSDLFPRFSLSEAGPEHNGTLTGARWKRTAARPQRVLALFSVLLASLALTFLVLQCFAVLRASGRTEAAVRRLSAGDGYNSCPVSSNVHGDNARTSDDDSTCLIIRMDAEVAISTDIFLAARGPGPAASLAQFSIPSFGALIRWDDSTQMALLLPNSLY